MRGTFYKVAFLFIAFVVFFASAYKHYVLAFRKLVITRLARV
jgi:hypothetical protein